jgi:hypothetical protein
MHLALTAILAAALCVSVWMFVRDRNDALEQLQSKARENAALKKRAETVCQ